MNMTNTKRATLEERRRACADVSETLEALRKIAQGFGLFSTENRQISDCITAILCGGGGGAQGDDAYAVLVELACARQLRARNQGRD